MHILFFTTKFKVCLISLLLFFLSIQGASAQYVKNHVYVSSKISFADYSDVNDWSGYSIAKIPPFSISVEKGLNSTFSAGGLVGYSSDRFVNDTLAANVHKAVSFGLGVVGALHYASWIEYITERSICLNDWDLYVSAVVLLEWESTSDDHVWNKETRVYENFYTNNFKPRIKPVAGVRYFVTPNFCMLLEVGHGNLGFVTTGLTWRFM